MSFLKNLFKGNTEKTLVVFDLCNLSNRIIDWKFIDKYENPVLLIFYDDRVSDQIKNFDSKYSIVKIALPSDIRQVPSYILGMTLTEFFQEKAYKKMVFAAVQSHYEFVLTSLAKRGVPIEFLLLEYQKQENNHKHKESKVVKNEPKAKEKSEKLELKVKEIEEKKKIIVEKTSKTTADKNTKTLKTNTSEPLNLKTAEKVEKHTKVKEESLVEGEKKVEKVLEIRQLDTKDLSQVCEFFMTKFNIGDVTSKVVLGGYIKQVTGKGFDKVFFTRDYTRFVDILQQSGCIEPTEEINSYIVKKAPTLDIFPLEVEVIPSEDRPFHRKRFGNNRFHKKN